MPRPLTMRGENASVLPFRMPQEFRAMNNENVILQLNASFVRQVYSPADGQDFFVDGLPGGSLHKLLKRVCSPT